MGVDERFAKLLDVIRECGIPIYSLEGSPAEDALRALIVESEVARALAPADGDALVVREGDDDRVLRISDVSRFVEALKVLVEVAKEAELFVWVDGADEAVEIVKDALGVDRPPGPRAIYPSGKTWYDSWIGREVPDDAPEEGE